MSKKLLIAIFLIFSFIIPSTFACSLILHVDDTYGTFVGRTMDWYEEMETNLIVYPRGMAHTGDSQDNPLNWTSKYGSIVATYHELDTMDGVNEKGLAAHVLWLEGSDYGKRDISRQSLPLMMWPQFYLDQFSTVAEAVTYTENNPFQLLAHVDPISKLQVQIHLAIEDASGDSAIIEYKYGMPKIYHDKTYIAMTNEPTYDIQLKNLKTYLGFGGEKPLPGSAFPSDRFVRAAYYAKNLPAAASQRDAIAEMNSVVDNISHPFESYHRNSAFAMRTIWKTVIDLSRRVYYFHSTKNGNSVFVKLDQFDLSRGSKVMKLEIEKKPDLFGDVSKEFKG